MAAYMAPYNRRRVLKAYGLSVEEYEVILKRQNGVCAICSQVCKTGRRLAVDHDHNTKKVRGLLCATCNTALGKFGDSPVLLRQAIEYLEAGTEE